MKDLGFRLDLMPLVGVFVNDLDATIEQYSRLFGLEFLTFVAGVDYELEYETSGEADTSPLSNKNPRLAFDTDDCFELIEVPDGVEGLRNIHYRVDDMDAALAHFAAQGLEPSQVIKVGNAREVVFDASVLSGARIALIQFEGNSFAEALQVPRKA